MIWEEFTTADANQLGLQEQQGPVSLPLKNSGRPIRPLQSTTGSTSLHSLPVSNLCCGFCLGHETRHTRAFSGLLVRPFTYSFCDCSRNTYDTQGASLGAKATVENGPHAHKAHIPLGEGQEGKQHKLNK